MQRGLMASVIGLGTAASALGQTAPEKPHLLMWPGSSNVSGTGSTIVPAPANAIPITRDDWNGIHLNNLKSAEDSADWAFDQLVADAMPPSGASVGWIDKAHLTLFPRYVAEDLFVNLAPTTTHPQDPDTDPVTRRDSISWDHDWSFFLPKGSA